MKLSLSHWYPGSGVVLDCIDSESLPSFLLLFLVQSLEHNQDSFINFQVINLPSSLLVQKLTHLCPIEPSITAILNMLEWPIGHSKVLLVVIITINTLC